ncbi:hypothetical protein [Streptomyces chartreusis]|uniref:hypothetical protein n=1 Tax=Streptomyces chartreusis TaxID=1969 RepID=UPI0033B6AD0B
MYWAVSSQSKHPAEAAEFVNFLLNDMNAVTPGESPVVTPNGGSGIERQMQRYRARSPRPSDAKREKPPMPSSRPPYRVGIIGTGGIANAHAEALTELSERARLVAVADVDRTAPRTSTGASTSSWQTTEPRRTAVSPP